jgi:L-amino acid N-acyltransferase YncA
LSFDLLSEVRRVNVRIKKAEYDQFPIVVELIHKAFEQYTVGSKIISELEQLALEQGYEETRVEVRRSLPANLAFYKSQGYMEIAEIEYPQKTDSWYIMEKELNQRLPNLDLREG